MKNKVSRLKLIKTFCVPLTLIDISIWKLGKSATAHPHPLPLQPVRQSALVRCIWISGGWMWTTNSCMCVRERCSAVRTFWATHLTEDAEHIGTDKEEEEGGTDGEKWKRWRQQQHGDFFSITSGLIIMPEIKFEKRIFFSKSVQQCGND